MKRNRIPVLLAATLVLAGCETAYYSAMETVGLAKRDILASRVESARDSQAEAKQEITDALAEFGKVVSYDGGELEARYARLASQLEDSERAAERVRSRIADVDGVGEALFKEWERELDEYTNASLRAQSAAQLRATRSRYDEMLGAMRRAEAKLEPALAPMRDQVLYLKHNLNAQAVAGLKGEVVRVDAQVNQLVRELDRAIAEADRFIANLQKNAG
jgi:NADH dehydrogenase/NADH:ubiquinone oxidoreductase subunit G